MTTTQPTTGALHDALRDLDTDLATGHHQQAITSIDYLRRHLDRLRAICARAAEQRFEDVPLPLEPAPSAPVQGEQQ